MHGSTFLTTAEFVVLAVQVVLTLLAIVLFAELPPSERHLARFASTYELRLTDANRPVLAHAIRWSRAWRLGGAVAAVLAHQLVQAATGRASGVGIIWLACGYALGATVGEAVRRHDRTDERPRASMHRRRARDHVRPWVTWWTAAMCALAALATLRFWQLGRSGTDAAPTHGWTPSPALAALLVGLVLIAVAIQLAVATWTARRPVALSAPDVDAAQHAVRSAAIVSLAGCALMSASLATSWTMIRVSWLASGRHDAWSNLHGAVHAIAIAGVVVGLTLSLRSIPRFLPIARPAPGRPAPSS